MQAEKKDPSQVHARNLSEAKQNIDAAKSKVSANLDKAIRDSGMVDPAFSKKLMDQVSQKVNSANGEILKKDAVKSMEIKSVISSMSNDLDGIFKKDEQGNYQDRDLAVAKAVNKHKDPMDLAMDKKESVKRGVVDNKINAINRRVGDINKLRQEAQGHVTKEGGVGEKLYGNIRDGQEKVLKSMTDSLRMDINNLEKIVGGDPRYKSLLTSLRQTLADVEKGIQLKNVGLGDALLNSAKDIKEQGPKVLSSYALGVIEGSWHGLKALVDPATYVALTKIAFSVVTFPLRTTAEMAAELTAGRNPLTVLKDKALNFVNKISQKFEEYKEKFAKASPEEAGEMIGKMVGEVAVMVYGGNVLSAVPKLKPVAFAIDKVAKSGVAKAAGRVAERVVKVGDRLQDSVSFIDKGADKLIDKVFKPKAKVSPASTTILEEAAKQAAKEKEGKGGHRGEAEAAEPPKAEILTKDLPPGTKIEYTTEGGTSDIYEVIGNKNGELQIRRVNKLPKKPDQYSLGKKAQGRVKTINETNAAKVSELPKDKAPAKGGEVAPKKPFYKRGPELKPRPVPTIIGEEEREVHAATNNPTTEVKNPVEISTEVKKPVEISQEPQTETPEWKDPVYDSEIENNLEKNSSGLQVGDKLKIVTKNNTLALRDENGGKIGTVPRGASVDVAATEIINVKVGDSERKFIKVKTSDGKEGYMAAYYLSKKE